MESCCYGDGWKMLRDFIEIKKGESVMDGNILWDESRVGWWVRVKRVLIFLWPSKSSGSGVGYGGGGCQRTVEKVNRLCTVER